MLPLPESLVFLTSTNHKFLKPRDAHYSLKESYELGGKDLYDTSEGLLNYTWYAWTDGNSIWCKRVDLNNSYILVNDKNITEIDLTFDQNMRPCVSYYSDGIAKLYWYDAESAHQVITQFPDIRNPRVSLDDKRKFNVANSDIIFAYQKDNSLCYRLQRERYTIEHTLAIDNTKRILWRIGMGTSNRFLFYWR